MRKTFTILIMISIYALCFSQTSAFAAMSDDEFLELCISGTARQVEEAINNGANVNAVDEYGETALMSAARSNRNPEVISVLLKNGADASIRDNEGKIAVDYAAVNTRLKNTDAYQELIAASNAEANTPEQKTRPAAMSDEDFLELCRSGTPREIETAIKDGANVNAGDEYGETALMSAAGSNRNPEVISVLLQNGADASIKDNEGKSAADYAAVNARLKNTDAYRQLTAAGGGDYQVPAAVAETPMNTEGALRPGIYDLEIDEDTWGEFNITYVNNKYEAGIELVSSNGHVGLLEGPAVIEGNRVTIKESNNPDAKVVITVKDEIAVIEANDAAQDYAGMGVSFSGTYQVKYYEDRNAARLGNLVQSGRIPQYVQEKGEFNYDANYYQAKITGDNVRLRSQPNTEARIVGHVNKDEVLSYLGEWTHPQGDKWMLVGYNPEGADIEEIVWVYGQYAVPITYEQYAAIEQQKMLAEQKKTAAENAFIEEIKNLYHRNYPANVGYLPVGRQLEEFLGDSSWSSQIDSNGDHIAICSGITGYNNRRVRLSVHLAKKDNALMIREIDENQNPIYHYSLDSGNNPMGEAGARFSLLMNSLYQGAIRQETGNKDFTLPTRNFISLEGFLEAIYRNY